MTDIAALASHGNSIAALDHLEELEEIVASGRRVPFSSGVVINEEHALGLVERIRTSLPETVIAAAETVRDRQRLHSDAAAEAGAIVEHAQHEAESILARARDDADTIVTRARGEAETIVTEGHADSARLIDEHVVSRQAHEQAVSIHEAAVSESQQLRLDADGYAREVMESLAEHLEKVSQTVEKGLRALPEPDRGRRRH